MDILLFGIQGSGKGTQGKILAEQYGLTVFETGGELRKMIQSGTELGHRIKSVVESGSLVDNTIIMQVAEAFLDQLAPDQPVVFDGIPRSAVQAQTLEALLNQHHRSFHGLLIQISEAEAMNRLLKRRICVTCKAVYSALYDQAMCEACGGALDTRKDDNAVSIEKRLEMYAKETLPVIAGYRSRGLLITVNGEQSIEAVTAEMMTKVKPLFSV